MLEYAIDSDCVKKMAQKNKHLLRLTGAFRIENLFLLIAFLFFEFCHFILNKFFFSLLCFENFFW